MTKKKISRRDFMKVAGLAGVSLPVANVVGQIGNDDLISSPQEFGGFLVKRLAEDKPPYEIDSNQFERFDQYYDAFNRMNWDADFQATLPVDGGFGVVADPMKPGLPQGRYGPL